MPEVQQKIISCPNGHYYDANKYHSCPYCSGSAGFAPTVDPFSNSPGWNTSGSFGETMDPFGSAGYQSGPVGNFSSTLDPYGSGNGAQGGFTGTRPAVESMGKTEYVDDSTPSGAPTPVVGWLVAVEGPCRGTDYRVHTGYNYIGRESGDIRIHGDFTISGEKDSVITFVPQTNRSYIAHEQGKNVLLVNNVPVLGGGVELHDYDTITIGTTKLIFVSFCGDRFSWNDKESRNG